MEEKDFDFGNNYKLKQNYYKEKYKNRGTVLCEQPPIRKTKDGKQFKPKGVTFYKVPDNEIKGGK